MNKDNFINNILHTFPLLSFSTITGKLPNGILDLKSDGQSYYL